MRKEEKEGVRSAWKTKYLMQKGQKVNINIVPLKPYRSKAPTRVYTSNKKDFIEISKM